MKEMINDTMELTMDELEQVNGGGSDNIFEIIWKKIKNTPSNPIPTLPPDNPFPFGPVIKPVHGPMIHYETSKENA